MKSTPARLLLLPLLCALASACDGPPDDPCEPGCPRPPPEGLARTFDEGTLSHRVAPRDGFGGLKVRVSADRTWVLETLRDSRFTGSRRLVAYAPSGEVLRTLAEGPREHFSDFTLHPSGELTLGVERTDAVRGGYDLVRLSADGEVRWRQPLPEPATLPASDLGTDLPEQPFRMKSRGAHALTDGWLRTEARGEDVAVAFLTLVNDPIMEPGPPPQLATGVMVLRESEGRYVEEWTRVVDGRHNVDPAAWAYDEFRWREAAQRPLLAVAEDGYVVVGRTWSSLRCFADSETFKQIPRENCIIREDVTSPMDTEMQPFAFTAFSPTGGRLATRSYLPPDVAEFVVFDMAMKGDAIALAGTAVKRNAKGSIDYYPSSPGASDQMTPYDGFLAVLGLRGEVRFEGSVGGERADHFSALRWTDQGLLAVGATGWDRWHGGMSISRGAGPLLALVNPESGPDRMRTLPLEGGQRHFHLLGVDVRGEAVVAVGLAEAPMTHAGDGGQWQNMTFGGLTVELR